MMRLTAPVPAREVRQGDWIDEPDWSGQVIRVRRGLVRTKTIMFITVSIDSKGVTRHYDAEETVTVVLED